MTATVITAVASLITAFGVLLTAITGFYLVRRTKSIAQTQDVVVAKTEHMTTLVNSNHEAMLRREEVLIAALQKAGIVIPPNEDIKKKVP